MTGQVIILGGTPRAGKTTVACALARRGYSMLSFDQLSDAIREGLPEVEIHDWTDRDEVAPKLFPFFTTLVQGACINARAYGVNMVIDMYPFTPEYIARLPEEIGLHAFFLGYPGYDVETIRRAIRSHAKSDDWIAQVDEDYLQVVALRCADMNETLLRQCAQYGYPLVDTGMGDARGPALGALLAEILRLENAGAQLA